MALLIDPNRVNCRLPQTPRTPTTAAAHYFDDIFTRSSKPRGEQPRVRRSSTCRSIGNRSSFNLSANGDDETRSADGSAYTNGEERMRRQSEADQHIAKFVTDQLERIRSNESVFDEDEFEAQLE